MHTQLIRASYYLLYLQKFKGYMKQNAGHIELYTGNNYFVGKNLFVGANFISYEQHLFRKIPNICSIAAIIHLHVHAIHNWF